MTAFVEAGEEAEVGGYPGQNRVEPDIVSVKRNQTKGGVQDRKEAHDHERGVDDRDDDVPREYPFR